MILTTKTDDLDDTSISVESPSTLNSHDMTSLEILKQCHLDIYPKKTPVCDDETLLKAFIDTVCILSGEYICFIGPSGKMNDEILVVTNYRLFLLMTDHSNTSINSPNKSEFKSFINVPIMIIETIEIKEIVFIYVYLKNAKTIRFASCKTTALSELTVFDRIFVI
ncbi:unnamed protein product [Brachionus calyciflorus]|uniref:GRAM domain-containing protein n=1 Tax=Brachionus calyciflorus TaxID=104777 RepID=A0A814AMR2_9BILA|nr:unnamed protein product [Brachionus calyciflorus]